MFAIPSFITAGLSLRASAVFPEIVAPKWAMWLYLRGPNKADVEGRPDEDGFLFVLDTAGLDPGIYWYALRCTDGIDTMELATGELEVKPDLVAADHYDGRTHCKKVLDAIEAVLEQRASHDQQSYTIQTTLGMRQLTRVPVDELLRIRRQYLLEYRRECAARTGQPVNRRVRIWM